MTSDQMFGETDPEEKFQACEKQRNYLMIENHRLVKKNHHLKSRIKKLEQDNEKLRYEINLWKNLISEEFIKMKCEESERRITENYQKVAEELHRGCDDD